MKIVEVEWFDAQTSTFAMTIEEIKDELKPVYSKSIGYLVHETKDYIVLGFLVFGNGMIKHHQTIPRKTITKITVIKEGSVVSDEPRRD